MGPRFPRRTPIPLRRALGPPRNPLNAPIFVNLTLSPPERPKTCTGLGTPEGPGHPKLSEGNGDPPSSAGTPPDPAMGF